MVVTGRVLAGIEGKTIVMTGAMQPASVRASDAVFHVGFALAAVQTLPPGVYVAMNGMIFVPENTVKDRAGSRVVSDSALAIPSLRAKRSKIGNAAGRERVCRSV